MSVLSIIFSIKNFKKLKNNVYNLDCLGKYNKIRVSKKNKEIYGKIKILVEENKKIQIKEIIMLVTKKLKKKDLKQKFL